MIPKTSLQSDGYYAYIDVLRVLSMLAVVFLHTAAGSLRGNYGSAIWHVSNVLTGIMSTSVPIFFMISGAMLLSSDKTASVAITFKKRLPKALVPFLAWSLVAILYFAGISFVLNDAVNWKEAVGKLKNIFSQPTTVHLWFMYALIPLYMLSPLLKKLVDAIDEGLAKYMLLIWLIFSSVLPTVSALVPTGIQPLFVWSSNFSVVFMNGYLGYFVLGYYLFKTNRSFSKGILSAIIVVDTALIALGTWWKTLQTEQYSELFKSYSRIFIVILSVAIFLLVKESLKEKSLPTFLGGMVKWLSSASFGVYLVHNLLVDFISRRVPLWPSKSFLILFGCYFAVLFASLLCIALAASIKTTSYIFTGLSYRQSCESLNLQFLFRPKNKSRT